MLNFALDKSIAFCFLAMLPVIYWFARTSKTKKVSFYGTLFILVFSFGTIEALFLSENYLRFILETVILILFFKTLLNKKLKLIALLPALGVLIVSVVSILVNERTNFFQLFLFSRDYFHIIFLIYVLINVNFKTNELFLLNKLIKYLFISQIIAGFIKLFTVGVNEPYIGTFSNYNGSQSLIFSLLGIAFCVSSYLYSRQKKYILFALLFISFATIGEKRATVFFVPLLFLIAFILFQKINKIFNLRTVRIIIISLFFVPLMFYFMVRLQSSFNPERKIWGSFDLEYVLNYSDNYRMGNIEGDIGSGQAPAFVTNVLLQNPWYNSLFGFGAGHIIYSQFNAVERDDDSSTTLSKYGVGYGARSGFLQLLLQIGFTGTFFYVLFFSSVLKHGFRKIIKNNRLVNVNDKILYLTALLFICVFFLDFFTYSHSLSNAGALSLSFAWVVSMFYRKIVIINKTKILLSD